MKKDDVVEYVKALELKPGTILVVDCNKVDLVHLANIRLETKVRVPVLPVDGTPSIAAFTRQDELAA